MFGKRFGFLTGLLYGFLLACGAASILGGLSGCQKLLTEAPKPEESLDAPIDGLTPEQLKIFARGDEAFGEVFTFETGLGPLFNNTACERCHVGDGRGHPSVNLKRFGKNLGSGQFDVLAQYGGPQFQERSMPGYPAEQIPAEANSVSERGGPLVVGLGLIEAILDATILANVDSLDANGDGISGRPQYIEAPEFLNLTPGPYNGKYLGRFGRKAGAVNLLQQTVNAYHQDIGITTDFRSVENFNPMAGGSGGDPVSDPELSARTVNDVVFYLQTLRPPLRRNPADTQVKRGDSLFSAILCGRCHTPALTTGAHPIAALSNKTTNLYSDLLLHDMGPDLADNFIEAEASGTEWRTTPLWGLGIIETVLGGKPFFLHDGRTSDLREVINFHKGEADSSRKLFLQLAPADQEALLKFLKSL
ncbi:MAG TPA: di-heme oxidoredictase family protein [candidate division Zixibacteria bacterium]|nr:di-heme oxidoredictase family protein [candidate division Zixibacteria bacterium]